MHVFKNTQDIAELLKSEVKSEKEKNRVVLINILANIRFLVRQGISLRGDFIMGKCEMNSNFIQLLKLRVSKIPHLQQWLEKISAKFTSPDIQNVCKSDWILQTCIQSDLQFQTS